MKILLIEPPWGASLRPSLGLHALQAHLKAINPAWRVDVRYTNLDFYQALPPSFDKAFLHAIFWSNPEVSWLAEAFFSPWSYDEATRDGLLADLEHRLARMAKDSTSERLVPPSLRDWLAANLADALMAARDVVPRFLADFARDPTLEDADLLGFGHHFNQLFGSLASAQAARKARPDLTIALGGASMTAPLAQIVQQHFPQIDQTFVGDAEAGFSELCAQIDAGLRPERSIHRFTARESVAPTADLDYSAFFDHVRDTRFEAQLRSVPVELTRDCYWARRAQCSFCGLPAERNTRTAKATEVVSTIAGLHQAFGVRHFIFADPAIHGRKHRALVARLAEYFQGNAEKPIFFFEVRADATRQTLEALARLDNVVVQVGVESFSHQILTLMKKGVSPIENVQFLKWCRELGVFPYYNILWGHPGEDPHEYDSMSALIPRLMHLTPPSGYTPVLLSRDSPLFEQGSAHVRNVVPWTEYAYTFPGFSREDLFKAAYYFDYLAVDADGAPITARPSFDKVIRDWQHHGRFGRIHLVHYREGDEIVISDNRAIVAGIERERVFRLGEPADVAMLEALGSIRTSQELLDMLSAQGCALSVPDLARRLSEFEAIGLVMREGDRSLLLSLAI